jgi:trehalose/maltose hydrolase-like predicted phosphorylase
MSDWQLIYDDWDPGQQPLREALCTLGNGYFATRGAFEEADAGTPHYPGTYLAAGYDRLVTEIEGREITNEDLVNWPNWLCLDFRPEEGEWLSLERCEVLDFRQELDLQRGRLERRVRVRDDAGRETSLISRRLVHMGDPHLAALHWTLTAENWSGGIEIRSGIDGTVRNRGVERYRKLRGDHLEPIDAGRDGDESIYLIARSKQSQIRMAQAARVRIATDDGPISTRRRTAGGPERIDEVLTLGCERGRPIRVEKVVAVHTSRDRAISEESTAAREAVREAPSFEELTLSHERAWADLWRRCDIEIGGPSEEQLALRLHVFHLLQTVSTHTIDLDAGVPARGLHGEAYRGHIFWDELFIFPFLNQSLPELTRALLLYRYRRLPAARRMAAESGFRGALYPWQSGSDGREESQVVHLNPRSGRWIPDNTHLQRHVNGAIAYNVWEYFQTTGDREFLAFHGAEMMLEIARFWSSAAELDPDRQRFEIHNVVGPDEYHTGYPGSDEPGLRNNAYTNILAAWVLRRSLDVLDELNVHQRERIADRLQLGDEEIARWEEVSRRMFVPFHGDGIISQFEGYDELEEFDWEGYRRKYGDIQRLDRILEAEGDTPNRYKASKQADALMLFYLFSADELEQLFADLEYPFDPESIPRIVDYYARRSSHGSTLSRIVHGWVVARSSREDSWQLFEAALHSDIEDIQGGTTHEGIHLGAMAGTTDMVQRAYTGVEMQNGAFHIDPCLPDELSDVRFRVRYRGHWILLHATQDRLAVSAETGHPGETVSVVFRGRSRELEPGETKEFAMEGDCDE